MSRAPNGPVRSVRWEQQTAIVEVAGEIDLGCSPAFQQEMLGVLDKKPRRMVVDLRQVGYMDSSGVASLVKLLSRTRKQDVGLVLFGLSDRVRSIFEITRLSSIFDIRAGEREALE